MCGGGGTGDGAFKGGDVLEELLFLGDEVCDTLALACVEGLVDGIGICAGWGKECIWGDGKTVYG